MIIHAEVIHNHITDATTEALHDIVTPILITTTVTHHTEDHYHVEAGDFDLGVSVAYSSMTVSVFKLLICIQPCIHMFSLLHLVISSSIVCTACQAIYSQGHVLD